MITERRVTRQLPQNSLGHKELHNHGWKGSEQILNNR